MNTQYLNSSNILARNKKFIPGGVVSVNRATRAEIVFTKGSGAHIWDAEGNRCIDCHAAFAPYILGHNDPYVSEAVTAAIKNGQSSFGTGTTEWEGRLAELICENIPWVESVQFLNTGSEATYQAVRLARAVTGRGHIIVIQGGYNGWHNDVSCNLMTPLEQLGPRISPGEYPYFPISSGIPANHQALVHPINFNDLQSVKYVCDKYQVAALITEPILQNIGVVKPDLAYLQALRDLADQFGYLLIFDEVKTGFRHAIGGYASIAGVHPDLVVYGKALANGYPIAALGGSKALMDFLLTPTSARGFCWLEPITRTPCQSQRLLRRSNVC